MPEPSVSETEDEPTAEIEECLQECLQKLKGGKRELILGYYAKEKQAKIDHRNELAQKFGITVETLRVRVFRIRESLAECIGRCLKRNQK
jgi:DNA-directed RNA polymerase specialized sigma24 family protein